ncbi:hypothetical protein F5B20DRAFT_567685 [Whalleya microplaca]|nr:hypothetical protein F5B20DRAFT_567685 [Whalleya microplaca]
MENPRDVARACWGDAQKIRSDILAKTSSLKKERGNTNYTPRFEEVELTMAEFRLACMQVIFHDFGYAVAKRVEHSLWQAHTLLNAEYRKVTSRLMGQNLVVEGRKLERLYRAFLKTSQLFYRGYIQRLSERFYIPELRQAAYGTDLESTKASSPAASPPSELCAMILKSCQITLVHLGDLARYRCQLSDKPKGDRGKSDKRSRPIFEQALEYYGLANIIDPEDGSAHHQLAVLYQLPGQHLDIVYHFHRAISIAKPHELGLGNLEREFKSLENPSSARRGPGKDRKDPSEAMISWFVRLHAFFFQGEQFSQQSELEEEVLHRIEIAMKSDGDEALLRKMILINIAAYDVATEKVKAAWTMTGSQSCQFLLRFNIRTILALLRLLKTALLDESAVTPIADSGSKDDESTVCFSQRLLKLIPLFRVYMAWICISGTDLVKYQAYLEPYVRDVYRFLADTLTLLNGRIDQSHPTTSSKYLLPEDNEALGLRPFCDPELPLFLQAEAVLDSDLLPKKPKVRKPRQQVFGRQYNPHTETIWRIRDIAFCGILLVRSANFPVAITILNHEGRDIESWVYLDETPLQVYVDGPGLSRMLTNLKMNDTEVLPHDLVNKGLNLSRPGTNTVEFQQVPAANQGGISSESQQRLNKGKAIEENAADSHPDSDVSEDRDMINMVNKLLDPDLDTHHQSSQTRADTSYGMDSSKANEVFGGLATNAMQPSPKSKTIPNLPWGYFYTPTPHRSSSQGKNQLNPESDYVPRSAHAQLRGFESSSYLNNLSTPLQPAPKGTALSVGNAQTYGINREAMAQNSPIQPSGLPATDISQHKGPQDSLEVSRNAVLDSLKYALFVQNGSNPESRLGTSPAGLQRPTSGMPGSPSFAEVSSPNMRSVGGNFASDYMDCPASQRATFANLHSSPGPPGRGRPVSKHGVRPGGGSSQLQDTGSPTSPAFGFPALENQNPHPSNANGDMASGLFQQQYSPWLQEPTASGSSFAFSHPSSLYGGTPAGLPVAAGSGHSVLSNGNYFNASTPFGRLGEGHNNREDPTHFRNQLKSTIGNIDNAYDRQVLQAALVDDGNKKRPK